MQTRTAWQAIAQRPLRFLTSSWPWRSLAYLVSGVAVGVVTGLLMIGLAAAGVLLLIVVVGIGVLVVTALAGIYVARFERWRLRLVDLDRAPDPHRQPSAPGLRAWLTTRLREQATWREFSFVVIWLGGLWFVDLGVLALTLWLPFYFMSVPIADPNTWPWMIIGIAMLLPAPYTITAWAGARAALTRALLAPRDDELGVRLEEVTLSRARLVDAFESERRRIERDLHDGAQQRLVSLSMNLGLARLDAAPGSPVETQLAAAQEQVSQVLSELRDLVRGVHPQVLDDHGLAAAIDEIADRSPIPVTVDIRLPGRVTGAVELTAYFVIAEALANIAKHSGASQATVRGRLEPDLLVVQVRDNGVGGADPAGGTGLTGLADRVAVVDGRVRLSSPSGGPTLLHVEIPCHSV